MISQDTFKIEAFVNQRDVLEVKPGEKAEVTFDSCLAGEKIGLPVASIDPAEIQENGNPAYKVSFELGKLADCLKSGVTANVEIVTDEKKNVLVIPAASVIKRDDQYFVLTEDKEQGLREKEIKVGLSDSDGLIEVLSGIEEGDRVASFSK